MMLQYALTLRLVAAVELGLCILLYAGIYKPRTPGLPETSKDDPARHGCGMRSIRYVVEKYDGLMSFQTEDAIFHLNLCLPVPEEGTAA